MGKASRIAPGLILALALGGCGGRLVDEKAPPTPSTTVGASTSTTAPAAPATTAGPATTAVPSCLSIVVAGLALNRDYARDVKSFAGADEAKYKARARILAADARRLGCPVPGSIQSFLK